MTACAECGGPVDPDVTHGRHDDDCRRHSLDGLAAWILNGCDCPEVCAACCTDPDCPLLDFLSPAPDEEGT